MDERKPPPTRNSSRTVALVAVAVLVVIAIAGIVLATLQRGLPADVAEDATRGASVPMTAASAAALAAEAEARPNQVVFATDSARVSTAATAKLSLLAEKAKQDKQSLTIVGKVEGAAAGKPEHIQLARERTTAVRGVLETNGIPLSRMETRIEGLPAGVLSAKDANRIDVNPR